MILLVRNEVDPAMSYHCDALASYFPEAREYDFPKHGGAPSLDNVEAVVISGSTAGVYEAPERPWIDEEAEFVRELVQREIPTLGICFGHQLINDALGGHVERQEPTHRLVSVKLADDPLLEEIEPILPAVHQDFVVERGDRLDPLVQADYYPAFGTRHREAPIWTLQAHPELGVEHVEQLREDFGWTETDNEFESVNAPRIFENFRTLVHRPSTLCLDRPNLET